METRPLGRTGMASHPELWLAADRRRGRLQPGPGRRDSQHCAGAGIRYFDTAWIYSHGQSEERVGLVAAHRRQEM